MVAVGNAEEREAGGVWFTGLRKEMTRGKARMAMAMALTGLESEA